MGFDRSRPSLSQGPVRVVDVEKRQKHPSARPTPSSAPGPVPDELSSMRFAEVARRINRVAVGCGLSAPAFRSPPRQPGLRRSITRRSDGSATVAVTLRGRPAVAVVADMIDGVLAANATSSTRSAEVRDRLWSAATPCLHPSAGEGGASGRLSGTGSRSGRASGAAGRIGRASSERSAPDSTKGRGGGFEGARGSGLPAAAAPADRRAA